MQLAATAIKEPETHPTAAQKAEPLKPYPAMCCADCLEAAGGRQKVHGIGWLVDRCPVCKGHTSVCAPEHFGQPALAGFEQP